MPSNALAQSALSDVSPDGSFVRKQSVFRSKIEEDGGLIASPHPPAKDRYVLYVSYACPWASRCLAFRKAKGLEGAIGLVVASPVWGQTRPGEDDHEGWLFDASYPGCTEEPHGLRSVRDLYDLSLRNSGIDPSSFETRYTVPVLFDKVAGVIVNNESSDIIRFFNGAFNGFAERPEVDLAPPHLLQSIDEANARMYESVCNGVYKCGFAQSQEAYDVAVTALFSALDQLDHILGQQRYLTGDHVTESDVRLFVTLVRFDEVYVVHFKCNNKCIREYTNLQPWLRDVFQSLDLGTTVNMQHIKDHYYRSHTSINRYGIVPSGPNIMADLALPHNRDRAF